ncbi:unnamed protein product [Urochloa humidicola]
MRPPAFTGAAALLLALLGLLVLQAACLSRPHPPTPRSSPLQGGAAATSGKEEKVRLGSSPPSCRGKCYECSPCTAVQVPTLSTGPSGPSAASRIRRSRAWARADEVATLSNYKPVGWKCQCRDRVYEP